MKLLILQGLPASGKTTWAREFLGKNKNWVRVNRDDLRNMRGEYWIPKQEDLITEWENETILIALTQGYSVILDATNLDHQRNEARVNLLLNSFPDLKVDYKFFRISPEEAIERDLKRANSVGQKVINKFYNKYLAEPVIYKQPNQNLPWCVIFDIDGTLAKNNGHRGPYQWDKVGDDLPNIPVVELYRTLEDGNHTFLFTGRDEVCREHTEEWLDRHGIEDYQRLVMRPKDSMIKDAKLKRQMYDEYIDGKYNVLFVVDDRDQVVNMWRRDLGLTCLQVDYGDF